MGGLVCNLVQQVFNGGRILNKINQTLRVLIPKTDQPSKLRMYRSISLCTVIYITFTKIEANRLKIILPKLIRPVLTKFVLGRHITENIIIAQKIIYIMRHKKGKSGQMFIPIRLSPVLVNS